jgi:hypothetical protein
MLHFLVLPSCLTDVNYNLGIGAIFQTSFMQKYIAGTRNSVFPWAQKSEPKSMQIVKQLTESDLQWNLPSGDLM